MLHVFYRLDTLASHPLTGNDPGLCLRSWAVGHPDQCFRLRMVLVVFRKSA